MTIHVGVIGVGVMGADHAMNFGRHVHGAELAMVADVDLRRALALAAEVPGVKAVGDAYELVRSPEVDAVVIASGDSTHVDLTLACIEARKPVLCEKPLASSLADAKRVVEAEAQATFEGSAPLVSVGFMRRFDPAYRELRSRLVSGECGSPLLVHCVSRAVAAGPGATTKVSMTNSAIHEFEVIPWLLGSPIVEVSWHAPGAAGDGCLQDPQLLLMRTASGVLATTELFLNAGYGYDIRCEVVGSAGTLAIVPGATLVADSAGARVATYPMDWRPRFVEAYRNQAQAWIDSLRSIEAQPLATASEALRASAVADAAIAAIGSRGVPVQVG